MRVPFAGRMERAARLNRERARLRERGDDPASPEELMEKGDGLAMLLAALITIVPVCLIALALLAGAGYWFIVR